MKTNSVYKPLRCKYCGSARIIPQVEGDPIGWVGHLYYQRKLDIRGSFAIENGTDMWSCADCSKSVTDDQWRWDDKNLNLIRTYEEEVNRVIDEYRPITEEQFVRLKGQEFVRAISMGTFKQGVTELLIVGDGDKYNILPKVADQTALVEEDSVSRRMFRMIRSLVDSEKTAHVDVWIERKDRTVLLEKMSTNRLRLSLQE